jgi:hypothetical protein
MTAAVQRTGFMRAAPIIVCAIAASCTAACARRVPEPATTVPGKPYISWVIMSGDSDNPDQDFVCQSDPRNDCVVPASRADARVFSDVHLYYHGVGGETRYAGTMHIGFFQGSASAAKTQVDIAVKKNGEITNQSVVGIVTSTPGTYTIDFDQVASVDANKGQPLREQLKVTVK